MIDMPIRRSPHNPITQTLDRLIEAERVETEQRAARAARRMGPAGGEADKTPLSPGFKTSPL